MAYDAAREVVVLYGGAWETSNLWNYSHATWEYNGRSWQKKDISGPDNGTSWVRKYHSMAYDRFRKVTVLFGGDTYGLSSSFNTWEYDGESWKNVTPTEVEGDTTPGASAGMVYDAQRGKTVLFDKATIWEFDGLTWGQVSLIDAGEDHAPGDEDW